MLRICVKLGFKAFFLRLGFNPFNLGLDFGLGLGFRMAVCMLRFKFGV